jgi:hypothetical protein
MASRRFSRSTPSAQGYTSEALPPEVVQCLGNARFVHIFMNQLTKLHLGTSFRDHPHVSLMNYTFIPAGEALPHEQDDCIIMTTSKDTKKFINICAVGALNSELIIESSREYFSSRLDYTSSS